jgi:DNA-binding transcriptional MocR family regulator
MGLCKIGTDTCSGTLDQRFLYRYAVGGGIDRQVRSARDLYRRKRDLLLEALGRHMPETVSWTRPEGGFYVWMTLPEGADSEALLRRAIEREKIAFVAGPPFFADAGRGRRHLRLSFSFLPAAQIEEGVRRIASAVAAST